MAVLPTGAGKTVVFSKIIARHNGPSVAIAHRRELVAQISRSLAVEGVPHRIVAPRPIVRAIAAANSASLGRAWVDPGARAGVAGVDSMGNACERWRRSITLTVQDEAHHPLQDNKWGKVLASLDGKLLGVTATPERADGKGLDGFFTELIFGPSMRDLIDDGHLAEYRLFAPASARLDLEGVAVSKSTGDYSAGKLRVAMKAAQITGDVVATYKRLAAGKLGITFVADVESAHEMAQAYCDAGVPALPVSAKTPPAERTDAIKRFARREVHQLVNVDLFGEGFDLSSAAGLDVCVEVVSMARPTHSYVVFAQQFGRALRPKAGKAIVIDHVGNTVRHGGPPDFPRSFDLAGRARRSSGKADDLPKVRVCDECTGVYDRELGSCPYCGHRWEPAGRGSPEQVDGDMMELEPAVLADMRRAAATLMRTDAEIRGGWNYLTGRISPLAIHTNIKRDRTNRDTQVELRAAIVQWAGVQRASGTDDAAIRKRFYLTYGIDILSAYALKAREAAALMERLR